MTDFKLVALSMPTEVVVIVEHEHLHLFLSEQDRELSLAAYSECTEKLVWGGKVVGVRVTLAKAPAAAVKTMLRQAYEFKAG